MKARGRDHGDRENSRGNDGPPDERFPRFKRNACVHLKHGEITATNRWGKTRSFPLSGAENSPKADGALNPGIDVWWLEDDQTTLLLVVDLEHFWPVEIGKLVNSGGIPERDGALSDQVLPMRADVFKIRDPPTVNVGIACAPIGGAAIALVVNKLTGPKGKDKEELDYLELFASADKDLDSLERSLPDFVKEPKPEPEAGAGSSPEQVDGS
jgi:hypothetical protein